MRSVVVSLLVATLVGAVSAVAQSPERASAPHAPERPSAPADDVVKLGTTLVQVDAVVTDKKGVPVTDLTMADFEVLQDKRPQELTAVSYVDTAAAPVAVGTTSTAGAPAPVAGSLREGDVRRTIAIVFDDLSLAFANVPNARHAIQEFVRNEVRPGDLVAIIRTSGGVGALQQFTSDRRVLDDAIEHLRWSPQSRYGASSFEPVPVTLASPDASKNGSEDEERKARATRRDEIDKQNDTSQRELATRAFAGGTLGTLSFVLEGMAALPGRKSLVLFSEGWSINDRSGSPRAEILDQLHTVTDLAGRASVSIYTADARQLFNPAYVDASIGDRQEVADYAASLRDSQDPLRIMADGTGGSFFASNDLERQLRRAVDDLKGYYLIAYTPEASTFGEPDAAPRFHAVEVRVRRPGLTVRARTGFFGVTDAETAARRTVTDRLSEAIASPFAASDVRLRVTPLFISETKDAATVRAYLHVDARDLDFKDVGDGKLAADVTLVAVLFGDNGKAVSHTVSTQMLVVIAAGLERIRRNGIVYTLNLPVEKPGVYQLRTAVRDARVERYGSAQQIVEVPNLKSHHIALSGIVLSTASHLVSPSVDTAPMGAAVRRFRPGTELKYAFAVYNPAVPRSDRGLPSLDLSIALWRDGEKVFEGPAQRMELTAQPSWARIYSAGSMKLSERLKPGEYVLQISVADRFADRKHAGATQWIDFEVVDPATPAGE